MGLRGTAKSFPRSFLFKLALAVATATAFAATGAHAEARIVTFVLTNTPTSTPDSQIATVPTGISASDVITGSDGSDGFVRHPDGTLEVFSVPDAGWGTYPTGIDEKGEVAGYYEFVGQAGLTAGVFLREPDATITTFQLPHGVWSPNDVLVHINSKGMIFGSYFLSKRKLRGFIKNHEEGITTFDCPSGRISVTAGNNLGVVAGGCNDGDFVRNSDGTFTFFDAGQYSSVNGMNDAGVVVGTTDFFGGPGFIRAPDGSITNFAVPNSAATNPRGINAQGTIAGQFTDTNGVFHGFVRSSDGTLVTFDPPDSRGTYPASINDGGLITGYYINSQGHYIGFIRFP